MKAGYMAEMGALHDKLTEAKAGLEEFYAKRIDDKDVVDEKKTQYDSLMSDGDAAILSFTTGIKLVKAALEPWLDNLSVQIFPYKFEYGYWVMLPVPNVLVEFMGIGSQAPPKAKAKAKAKSTASPAKDVSAVKTEE